MTRPVAVPVRLKYLIAVGNVRPVHRAPRATHAQPSRPVSQCISLIARSRSKPHGITRITSGSATAKPSHVRHSTFSAQAISSSSGIQLAVGISGSIHSIHASRGRAAAACPALTASAMARMRSRSLATSCSPRASISSDRATRRMSSHTSLSELGISETTCGRLARHPATDRSTSRKLTAQTSQWICVRICVGCKRSNTSSNTW